MNLLFGSSVVVIGILALAIMPCVLAAATGAVSANTVGLYAPDRYDGIPDMCLKPMDFGYCRAKVKRYYFDMRRMKCAMFYFGGCAGNVNNFKTIEECNKVCLDGYVDENSAEQDTAAVAARQNSRNTSRDSNKSLNNNTNNSANNTSNNKGGIIYKNSKYNNNNYYNTPNTTQVDVDDDYDN